MKKIFTILISCLPLLTSALPSVGTDVSGEAYMLVGNTAVPFFLWQATNNADFSNAVVQVAPTGGGGGSGTVTHFSSSSLSPLFSTTVATPTTTPVLSYSLTAQSANVVFAGPTSGGSTAPTFRALVAGDVSFLGALYYPLAGNPSGFLTANQTITLSGELTGSGTTGIALSTNAQFQTDVTHLAQINLAAMGVATNFNADQLTNSAKGSLTGKDTNSVASLAQAAAIAAASGGSIPNNLLTNTPTASAPLTVSNDTGSVIGTVAFTNGSVYFSNNDSYISPRNEFGGNNGRISIRSVSAPTDYGVLNSGTFEVSDHNGRNYYLSQNGIFGGTETSFSFSGFSISADLGYTMSATNTMVVTATGLTNNSSLDTYLISVTAGSAMTLNDNNNVAVIVPAINSCFPLKPGWKFHGTTVTATAVIISK